MVRSARTQGAAASHRNGCRLTGALKLCHLVTSIFMHLISRNVLISIRGCRREYEEPRRKRGSPEPLHAEMRAGRGPCGPQPARVGLQSGLFLPFRPFRDGNCLIMCVSHRVQKNHFRHSQFCNEPSATYSRWRERSLGVDCPQVCFQPPVLTGSDLESEPRSGSASSPTGWQRGASDSITPSAPTACFSLKLKYL